MNIIYSTIYSDIRTHIDAARRAGRTIRQIELTHAEWARLVTEMSPFLLDVPRPDNVGDDAFIEGVKVVREEVVRAAAKPW